MRPGDWWRNSKRNRQMDLLLDILVCFFLIGGLFFMTVAGVGLVRMPDLYHRMHAATKGVTLGISGILIGVAIALSRQPDVSVLQVWTKTVLIIMFQFVANPVGAHLLAKAAHLDKCPKWEGTIDDELDKA